MVLWIVGKTNLLDGCNKQSDDYHTWLTPFVPDTSVVISFAFDKPVTLGAIRFWNYAKTPTRGVRQLQVLLDGRLAFGGVLACAPSKVSLAAAYFALHAFVVLRLLPCEHASFVYGGARGGGRP